MTNESRGRLPIWWNDVVVGHVDGLKCDNFFLYGGWAPGDSDATKDFLAAIGGPADVVVRIGGRHSAIWAYAESVEGGMIDMKHKPE